MTPRTSVTEPSRPDATPAGPPDPADPPSEPEPTNLRDEHTAATRRRIVQAVTAVAANEHPANFTVPAVARAAGVSVRTVYRYFPTKEDLLDAIGELGDTPTKLRDVESVTIADFLAALPDLFGDLHENRTVLRQQLTNPVLREARGRRLGRRAGAMRGDLANHDLGSLPDDDADRLVAMCCVLSSSVAMLDLTEQFGLEPEEAGALSRWAIEALLARAHHTKEVGRGPHHI